MNGIEPRPTLLTDRTDPDSAASCDDEVARESLGSDTIFRPLPFAPGAHLQTIAAMFWPRRAERFPSVHELVPLPDGDRLVVVTSTPATWRPDQRTVVMVHGLCGCYGSPYMSRITSKLFARGVRVVRVNLRGCGSGRGLARHPYHSGRSEDVRAVLEWLAKRDLSPVTLIGFSLGGNIVLKLAGEDGARPTGSLDSVAGVSAPIDLVCCSQLIELPRNRIYSAYFVRRLLADVRERQRYFPDSPPLNLPRRVTLKIFDDCYTAPRSGFASADDYYRRASSAPLIPNIAIPTMLLTSRDDPFIACEAYEQLPNQKNVQLVCTDHGGHLGFLGFTGQFSRYRWMDHFLVDWVTRFV